MNVENAILAGLELGTYISVVSGGARLIFWLISRFVTSATGVDVMKEETNI